MARFTKIVLIAVTALGAAPSFAKGPSMGHSNPSHAAAKMAAPVHINQSFNQAHSALTSPMLSGNPGASLKSANLGQNLGNLKASNQLNGKLPISGGPGAIAVTKPSPINNAANLRGSLPSGTAGRINHSGVANTVNNGSANNQSSVPPGPETSGVYTVAQADQPPTNTGDQSDNNSTDTSRQAPTPPTTPEVPEIITNRTYVIRPGIQYAGTVPITAGKTTSPTTGNGGVTVSNPPGGGSNPGGPPLTSSDPPRLVNNPSDPGTPPHLINNPSNPGGQPQLSNPPGPGLLPPHNSGQGGYLPPGSSITWGVELPPLEAEPLVVMGAAAPAIDLELVDVRLVDVGNIQANIGPRFRLFCRNNGTLEAPKFQISLMADLGKELTKTARLVTVDCVGIKPGQTQAIDVQLPVEVLKMTTANDQWPKPFDLLVAVADSDNRVPETNEDNNVLTLNRDAIKPLASK